MSQEAGKQTPTDVLMRVMEEFGEEEPEHVVIIWTFGDSVTARSNTRVTQALGMVESCKDMLLRSVRP